MPDGFRDYAVPINLATQTLPERTLLTMFSIEEMRSKGLCPLFWEADGKTLVVVMLKPEDVPTVDWLRHRVDHPVKTLLCKDPDDFEKFIGQIARFITESEETVPPDPSLIPLFSEEAANIDSAVTRNREEYEPVKIDPVTKTVNDLILSAVRLGASDIHIEARSFGFIVRFRVDGRLKIVKVSKSSIMPALVSRIKVMSGMDIAIKFVPQDGRYPSFVDGRPVDLRISTLPGIHGESVSMRILDRATLLPLPQLGFNPDQLAIIKQSLRIRNGIILVTGPTGSGKTTTLYAFLRLISEMSKGEKNTITIEDPVEYELIELPDVTQTQAHNQAGYTYEVALTALLRQDPDVIMVGEIRNRETAEVAIRLAQIGRLILSTIHTNNTLATISRLTNIGGQGIDHHLIATTIKMIVSQALVRKICPACKESYQPSPAELQMFNLPDDTRFYRGKGCEKCRDSGYRGRTGIFEILMIDDQVGEAINLGVDEATLRKLCLEKGMIPIIQDAARKIAAGVTTVEEVIAATHSGT